MKRLHSMLDALKEERREDLRSFILSTLETMAPTPQELRELADLVNVDRIKSVDDAEILIKDFNKVESALRKWAEILEILYASKKR